MFLPSCKWKWKETSTRDFLSHQKTISSMDIFKILELSANDFRVKTKGGKQQHYKKLKQIRYLTLSTLLSFDEGSVINQSWSMQFLAATFSQKALLGSWTTCYVSATCEKVSIATSLFSKFIHQNTKTTTGLKFYNILEERPKAFLKRFLIGVDTLTLRRRP